jgi:tetratricopeptide (TPR) repeat protein
MVLPAPPAHAAPPAGAWLDRLSLILRLSGGGVIVLLDRARPERLGEVARYLLRERSDAEVLTEAPALGSLPEGSTAILCVRATDAGWLNQERPVVQARALRLVLFSDEETTLHLSRAAVDFYDWISHRIDCPAGPPAFAVRALRRAACARAPAIAWGGGDLEGSFAQALPGRRLARASAAEPYAALVERLAPRPRTWIAVEGVDDPTRLRRALWAAAEAGRRGRLVLVEPIGETSWPGLPRAHARPLSLEEGAGRLREAGIGKAVRLAAMLELEPGAIEGAAALAGAGVPEGELESIALREEDPGTALQRLMKQRRLQRAPEAERHADDLRSGPRGRLSLPDWPARVEMALWAGDSEVAAHWAAGWRAATGGGARSTAALARVRLLEGAVGEALALVKEARHRAGSDVDEDTRLELSRAEGLVLSDPSGPGRAGEAIARLEEALRLARRLGRGVDETDELHDALVRALLQAGRLNEADRALDTWTAALRAQGSPRFNPIAVWASAMLKLGQGDARAASQMLEQALARWPLPDYPSRGPIEQLLAQAWIAQERYREAEGLLREAIERLDRVGRPALYLRHEHGRALLGLGRFREAEEELRRVLEEASASRAAASTRYDLARCVAAQGRLDEAEALLEESMVELRRLDAADGSEYATMLSEKARVRRQRSDLSGARELLSEALALEERTHGREHPALIPTLMQLAWTRIDLGEPREAEPLLRRAVRLAERTGDRPNLATALGLLARAQAAQGFQHARDAARRALAIWGETQGGAPPALRRELDALAAGASPHPSTPSPRRK